MNKEEENEGEKDIVLWVDDLRKPPNLLYTHWAKSYDEAIKFLDTGRVVHISLDHDLGSDKTGYDITKYIEANTSKIKKIHWRLHSDNPVGRNNMKMAMQQANKLWSEK